MSTTSLSIDRAQGFFLGLACGNALGLPFENVWPKAKIQEQSQGRIRDIDPLERDRPWDDDTAEAVLSATLLTNGTWTVPSLIESLQEWRKSNGRGIGNLTNRVLDDLEGDEPSETVAKDAAERLGKNWSSSNGGLIRSLPACLLFAQDRQRLVQQTILATEVTHANPLCLWSSVALNLALSDMIQGLHLDVTALSKELTDLGAPEEIGEAVRASRAPLPVFQLDGKTKSFCIKAMQVGFWAVRIEAPIEEAIETIILEGGDTDTNGAIVGAILGLRHGASRLPKEWISSIHAPQELERLGTALAEMAS